MVKRLKEIWEENCHLEKFSKLEVIDNFNLKVMKNGDYGICISKNLCPTSFEDAFIILEVKNSKFRKKNFDFKNLLTEKNEEDSLLSAKKNVERTILKKFYEISATFGIDEFMYFMFPMYEKFSKIYPVDLLKKEEDILGKTIFMSHVALFIRLSSNHFKDKTVPFLKICSNENLKEVFLTKKKNIFLESFVKKFSENGKYYSTPRQTYKEIDIRLFNELNSASSQGKKDIVDPYRFINHSLNSYYGETKEIYETLDAKMILKNLENGEIEVIGIDMIDKGIEKNLKNGNKSLRIKEIEKCFAVDFMRLVISVYFQLNKQKTNTDFYQVLKYLKLLEENEFLPINESLPFYSDYLKMSNDLYEKYERFPKRLIYSHNKVAEVHRNIAKFKDFDEGLQRRYQFLKFLEGEIIDGYSIVVPKTSFEIVNEGKELNHCVSGYVDRMASNETTIIFIRKTDNIEKPLYTMEISNGRIRQFSGHSNSMVPENLKQDIERAIYRSLKIINKKGA